MFDDPIDAERGRLRPAECGAENGVGYGGLVLAIASPIGARDAAIAQRAIPNIVGVVLYLSSQVVRSPLRRRDVGPLVARAHGDERTASAVDLIGNIKKAFGFCTDSFKSNRHSTAPVSRPLSIHKLRAVVGTRLLRAMVGLSAVESRLS